MEGKRKSRVAHPLARKATDDGKNGGIFIATINTLPKLPPWSRSVYTLRYFCPTSPLRSRFITPSKVILLPQILIRENEARVSRVGRLAGID